MTTTDHLISELDGLGGDASQPLEAEALQALEQLADSIPDLDIKAARSIVQARLPERGVHPRLHFLLARLSDRAGDRNAARNLLARLVERLNQDGEFEMIAAVLTRMLPVTTADATVPMLVRAHRETSGRAVMLDRIQRWRDQYPGDRRLIWLQGLAENAEQKPESVGRLAEVLPYLAREQSPEDLEEAALLVIESVSAEEAPHVTSMIKSLLVKHRFEEVITYIDLGLDALLEHGQAEALWQMLSPVVAAEKSAKKLREPAVRCLRHMHADDENYTQMIDDSNLADKAKKFAEALKEWKSLTRFPQGAYVEHTGWGVGQILSFDGDTLVIRFKDKPAHQMKRSLAERALDVRDPGDLRVLTTFFADRVEQFKDSDPAGLVHAALLTLGGSGRPRDLRRMLTQEVMTTNAWTGWWRKTRISLEGDERFDLTETFQDVYKIADPSAARDAVLRIDDREEPTRQIKLLRRFLEQHPETRERTIRAYTRRLERWLKERRLTMAERMLVRIVLLDWHPERKAELVEELVSSCERGFDLAELTVPADQELVLELGLADASWQPVALAGLATRLKPIRDQSRAIIEERLGTDKAAELYRSILENSPSRSDAVLEVIGGYFDESTEALARQTIVDVFLGGLALVSDPDREAVRNRALRYLASDGPVFTRLDSYTPTNTDIERVATAILEFRASDALLNPMLKLVEAQFGSQPLEALRRRRQRESEKIAARMDDGSGFPSVLYMTQASYDLLKQDAERVDMELRTTIPRSIQAARELGDLRENAEYDSAKMKQKQYNDRLAMLADQLSKSAIIEEAQVDGARVSVGTEVQVELLDRDERKSYWVLGYNDSHHGDNVVSFQSEVGRALWGRSEGEEFSLPGPGADERARVAAIRVRLPQPGPSGA